MQSSSLIDPHLFTCISGAIALPEGRSGSTQTNEISKDIPEASLRVSIPTSRLNKPYVSYTQTLSMAASMSQCKVGRKLSQKLTMLHITKASDVAATTFHLAGRKSHRSTTALSTPQSLRCLLVISEVSRSTSTELRTLTTLRPSGGRARGCLGSSSLRQTFSSL